MWDQDPIDFNFSFVHIGWYLYYEDKAIVQASAPLFDLECASRDRR